MYTNGVLEEMGRDECDGWLLYWTCENPNDLESKATGTMETHAIKIRTWFVDSHDREWKYNTWT